MFLTAPSAALTIPSLAPLVPSIKLLTNATSSLPLLNNNWKAPVTLNPSNENPLTSAANVTGAENTASSALSAALPFLPAFGPTNLTLLTATVN